MSLKFTPPKNSGRYALYVDSDGFYIYGNLGVCKNAWYPRTLRGRFASKIVELIGGEWFVLYDIPAGGYGSTPPWVRKSAGYENTPWGTTAARPMTNEEYAEFRMKVQLEQLHAQGKLNVFGPITTVSVPNYTSSAPGIIATAPQHVMPNGRPVPGSGIERDEDEMTGPNWRGGTR